MDWNRSEYVVHIEEQTRRPTEGVTSPAPLRHSVIQFHLDSQPGRNKLKPDQSGDLFTERDTTQTGGCLWQSDSARLFSGCEYGRK